MNNLPRILFESYPDFTGSAVQLYNYMKSHGIDSKYQLLWAVDDNSPYKGQNNTISFFNRSDNERKTILADTHLVIDSNRYIHKLSNNFRLHVRHGLLLKRCDNYVVNIGYADAILTTSRYMQHIDQTIYPSYNKDNFIITGLPALDELYTSINLYDNGFIPALTNSSQRFNKIIYWMPTFRQHRLGGSLVGKNYEYSVPILHSTEDWYCINELCRKLNVLIMLQYHHAQATPKSAVPSLSNIRIITDELKRSYSTNTYNIMSMSDALITDYSAAYYEYLMLNRPIGLIVEDLVEYNKLAGFYIPYLDIIKGEYMMNIRQLESFVQRIGQGIDIGYSARANSIERIHQYVDNHSTDRVIDWLLRRHLL